MWPFSPAARPAPPRADDRISNRDILADDRAMRARTRWTRMLIIFLRTLALVCLARGLIEWSRILGFLGPENGFESETLGAQVTMALYAVLNCVAAVGLWLTSAWGRRAVADRHDLRSAAADRQRQAADGFRRQRFRARRTGCDLHRADVAFIARER